jgi:hypothetical protein
MNLPDLRAALDGARYETARRIGFALLANSAAPRAEVALLLHDALIKLADFSTARDLLESEAASMKEHSFEATLRLTGDLRILSHETHYRTSAEARQGYTVDEYQKKYRQLTEEALERARQLARTLEEQEALRIFEQGQPPIPYSRPETIADDSEVSGNATLCGRILLPDGTAAASATVTLGLRVKVDQPDTATFVIHSMHSYPRVGPLRKLTAVTDEEGRFAIDGVPAGCHDFLAVTLDPLQWEVPTRFLARSIQVAEGQQVDLGTLHAVEWTSAPSRPFPSPHPETFEENGITWSRVREWKLRNPFYYDFPRQLLTLPVSESSERLRIRITPDQDEPFQLTSEGASLLTGLAPRGEQVIALYESTGTPYVPPTPPNPLQHRRDPSGNWEIDTGVAAFRLSGPEAPAPTPPLLALRGPDGVWRGAGRFRLPDGASATQRSFEVIEDGPLLFTARISYVFTNGCRFSLTLTALAGTPLLLARETSDAWDGAAFEFSLREFSGGRGFLHWSPENGSRHWNTLAAENKIVGQLPESVPWWIPPQGFGYAITKDGLESQDYIGVFTRRRGEWIDRAFEKIAQGPIDENGQENRELEWPHPEMVGSSISMIHIETSEDGDAYLRFGFFDGERQWGLLAGSFADNDGPWKQFGSLQHAYSSPRLQEFKDWHFDLPDTQARPHLVARRGELIKLRKKTTEGTFAGLWDKVRREARMPGPRDGLLFAIDNDPLVAWEKRILLNYVADNRASMTLLGRDWSDMYSPVGGRDITKWAEEYDLIAASGVFTPDEEHRIRDFLILMGHMFIEEDFMNWRFNGRNANFEADRTDIVGAVGLVFQGHPDADYFLDHVLERTRRSLLAYCTPGSGRWYENPACYYLHASKCRINLVFHLAHKGLVDLESIPRLKDFLRWGIVLLTPPHPITYGVMRDGGAEEFALDSKVRKVPPVGDHAGIGKWLSEHYAYMGKLYLESDPDFGRELLNAYFCSNADGLRLLGLDSWENNTPESEPEGTMTSSVAGNPPLLFCNLTESDLPTSPQLDLLSRRLEGFGSVFRNKVNTPAESYLLVKQGPGGYRYHRTEGSFLLFSDGKPLVFDGGEAGETWRHSTLSFHDVHMPLSPARVERHFDSGGFQFVQGAHPVILEAGQPVYLNDSCRHELVEECYRRFRLDPPAVARAFAWIDDDYLVIHDDLSASRPALSHWHLQVVGGTPQKLGVNDYRFPGRFGLDLRVILPGQTFESEHLETLPILHYTGTPETWFAMEHLQLTRPHASHYLAILRPEKPGAAGTFDASTLEQDGAIVGASIRHEAGRDLLWFCRPGLDWQQEDIHFQGTYGALLQREGRLRLVLAGAGTLRAGTISLTSGGPSALLEQGTQGFRLSATGAGSVLIEKDGTSHIFHVSPTAPLEIELV